MFRVNAEIISVGTEVIVNNIENYAETLRVRLVDEMSQVVGSPIQTRRRKKIHAIVTPSKISGEIRNGHDFDHADANARQLRQLFGGGPPASFRRECADVHFVNDLAL